LLIKRGFGGIKKAPIRSGLPEEFLGCVKIYGFDEGDGDANLAIVLIQQDNIVLDEHAVFIELDRLSVHEIHNDIQTFDCKILLQLFFECGCFGIHRFLAGDFLLCPIIIIGRIEIRFNHFLKKHRFFECDIILKFDPQTERPGNKSAFYP